MVQEADLKSSVEVLKQSVASTSDLLAFADDIAQNKEVDPEALKQTQRSALLDSLRVKRFHKLYKTWDNERRDEFIEKEIRAYNKRYAQMTRLHTELNELDEKYADTKNSVLLPKFKLSIQTLQKYEDGELLKYLNKDAQGIYPSLVSLDELFSLDPSSSLAAPDYKTFNKLVNTEFSLRSLCQIKYEVLLRVKQHLSSKNSQWSRRDTLLHSFLTTSLRERIDEVKKIRASESQDLRDIDVDLDIDEYSDEGEEDDEEKEKQDDEEGRDPSQAGEQGQDGDEQEEQKEEKEQDGELDEHAQTEEHDDAIEEDEDPEEAEVDEEGENAADADETEDPQAQDTPNVDADHAAEEEVEESTDMLID